MKITANNYYNQTLRIQTNNNKNLKYNDVCFKSRDLLDLSESNLLKKIRESISNENFLGQGTEAVVYRIKGTKYCVRVPYRAGDICSFFTKELTLADRVNHIEAKLAFGASIMKYIKGITLKWYMKNDFSRHKLQEEISEMPVKSYTNLLHQIANGIDNEMLFDYTGGNLIVDTKKKKLTAIDFYAISENPREVKPLTDMYSILTSYGAEAKTGKKIFDKIIDAGLEEFKPNKFPCMDVALFDFPNLCERFLCVKSIPNKKQLMDTVKQYTYLLKDLKKIEIVNKTFSKLLKQQINDFRKVLHNIR